MIKTTSKYEICQIERDQELSLEIQLGKSVSQIGKNPIYRQNAMYAGLDKKTGIYHPIGHYIKDSKLTRYYKDLPWSAFVIPKTGIPYIAQVDITKLDAKLAFYLTPSILSNGTVFVNSAAEGTASDIKSGSNYRSLIGITKVGTVALVRTLVKMTLQQAGQLMKDLGYYNAGNLDGGGSVSGGAGDYAHGYERPVSSALVVTGKTIKQGGVEMRQNDIKVSENFMLHEFESPDTHEVIVHQKLIDCLQKLRNKYGPTHINSGYRTPEHNKKVGGVEKTSQHLFGTAVDIHLKDGWTPEKLAALAKECGFTGIGLYKTFVHMDVRDVPTTFDKR